MDPFKGQSEFESFLGPKPKKEKTLPYDKKPNIMWNMPEDYINVINDDEIK